MNATRRHAGATGAAGLLWLLLGAGTAGAETGLVLAGSERMAPLARELAAGFQALHPGVDVTVEGGGSSAGIAALQAETASVALVARPATEEERGRFLRKRGADLVGVPVAVDAVVAFVRTDNPLQSLTLAQLADVCRGRIRLWEKLAIAVEGTALRPPGPKGIYDPKRGIPIALCAPAAKFGAAEFLRTRVMQGIDFSPDLSRFDTAGDLVRAVVDDPNALGVAGRSQATGVRLVPIALDATSSPVAPTAEALRSRAYPLTHYLYFYFAGEPSGSAREFLAFALSSEGQAIVESPGGALGLSFVPPER